MGPQRALAGCPAEDDLGLRLTRLGGCPGEAARPPCSPLPMCVPLVSTAWLDPNLPAASDGWGLRARVPSGAAAPGRGSWAKPGPRSPGEGSGLRSRGPRKASKVPGSSTCTVTSSRNLEKGSLASRRRSRRARGPLAGSPPVLGGLGVHGRLGDARVSSWPGHAAQLGPDVWSSGFPAGLGLGLWLRGSSLYAPSLGAWALGSMRGPWPSCLRLPGSGPRAWELAPDSIFLSQASASASLTPLLSFHRALSGQPIPHWAE